LRSMASRMAPKFSLPVVSSIMAFLLSCDPFACLDPE
jgi:hypothetical protein